MGVLGVIPVRLKSSRFPNKLIQKFNGKRIIDHVIENALKLDFIDDLVIATDDKNIGEELINTYKQLKDFYVSDACCGTHRVYKCYQLMPNYDYYVSIPADEPTINSYEVNISQFKLKNEIISFYTKFYCNSDLTSPLSCKIVTDKKNYMVYNSRNVVPINKSGSYLDLKEYKKHVGIFIFPKFIFEKYKENLWTETDDIESLEQNRFMQQNVRVKLYEINHIGFGIDIESQIKELEDRIKYQP